MRLAPCSDWTDSHLPLPQRPQLWRRASFNMACSLLFVHPRPRSLIIPPPCLRPISIPLLPTTDPQAPRRTSTLVLAVAHDVLLPLRQEQQLSCLLCLQPGLEPQQPHRHDGLPGADHAGDELDWAPAYPAQRVRRLAPRLLQLLFGTMHASLRPAHALGALAPGGVWQLCVLIISLLSSYVVQPSDRLRPLLRSIAPLRLDGLPTPPTSPQRPGVPLAHPLLVASSQPPIYFDLKRPPTELRLAPQTLNEPASHPPSSYITLVIPGLIWTIEIPSARTVTVNDILRALYEKLQRPADKREYDAHSQPVQQITSSTFAARRRTPGDGLKRIDFLGPKTRFAGMSRIQDGSDRWVVHFV